MTVTSEKTEMTEGKTTERPWQYATGPSLHSAYHEVVAPDGTSIAEFVNAEDALLSVAAVNSYDGHTAELTSLRSDLDRMREALLGTTRTIAELMKVEGAPGDWGYNTPKGQALFALYTAAQHARAVLSKKEAGNG